ncbi:hypothetical protein JCM16303_006097 [Sporobolomyces ruberrimus]
MSGFSSKSVFSICSTTSTSSDSSTLSTSSFESTSSTSSNSSSFSNSKIAWLSSLQVEEAIEREKRLLSRDPRNDNDESFGMTGGEEGGRKDWKRSVGPNTGRKLGKMLSSKSTTSIRSLKISSPLQLQLKPLEDPSTAFNRTPPLSTSIGKGSTGRSNSSASFKWFF